MSSPLEAAAACPLFAIAARVDLVAGAAELSVTATIADVAAERARAGRVADAYLASVIEGLVLVFVDRGPGVSGGTAGLLRNLAGVVTSVTSSVLGHGIGRADAEALLALRRFLHTRVRATPEGPWAGVLVFPLDAPTAGRIADGSSAVAAGRWDDARAVLAEAMAGVVDLAIRHHLEEPIALLRPGFVVRQALALGVGAIRTGALGALRRGIDRERDAQVEALARFLDGSLRPAP